MGPPIIEKEKKRFEFLMGQLRDVSLYPNIQTKRSSCPSIDRRNFIFFAKTRLSRSGVSGLKLMHVAIHMPPSSSWVMILARGVWTSMDE